MVRILKILFLSLFILILVLPSVQKELSFIEMKPLKGAYYRTEFTHFSLNDWFSGDFQDGFSKWLEENIGFREFFVRLFNQYRYSLLKVSPVKGAVIGKDRVLYHRAYCQTYVGEDFIGQSEIKENVNKIKFIQEELAEKNIQFLFILAPGKASIYPEFMPPEYDTAQVDSTNYNVYQHELKKAQVNHIDFINYFKIRKPELKYPVFPKNGVHWSGYAAGYATDTMFKYLEFLSGQSLRSYTYSEGEVTNKDFRFTDNDIGDSYNLLFRLRAWDTYYPQVTFKEKSNKPKLLIIGDSFTQSFYGFAPYFQNTFSDSSRFWGYYKGATWPSKEKMNFYKLNYTELPKEVSSKDFVVIVSTEINLKMKGFDFIDDLYLCYTDSTKAIEVLNER